MLSFVVWLCLVGCRRLLSLLLLVVCFVVCFVVCLRSLGSLCVVVVCGSCFSVWVANHRRLPFVVGVRCCCRLLVVV